MAWSGKSPGIYLGGIVSMTAHWMTTTTVCGLTATLNPTCVSIIFRVVHQSVESVGKEFYEYLRRRVWVTPMSYLELLGSFKRQLAAKRAEVGRNRSRLQVRIAYPTQLCLALRSIECPQKFDTSTTFSVVYRCRNIRCIARYRCIIFIV